MRLKYIEKNVYVDIDTAEEIIGDPMDLNIHVIFFMDTIMHFGKYRGQEISKIWEKDPSYIKWMKKEGFTVKIEYEATERNSSYPVISCRTKKILKEVKKHLDNKMVEKYGDTIINYDDMIGDYYDPEDDDCPF